jgi:hypothetical protein
MDEAASHYVAQVNAHISLTPVDDLWATAARGELRLSGRLQAGLSKDIHAHNLAELKLRHTDAENASLMSAMQKHTALWYTALPTCEQYTIPNLVFNSALRRRLHLAPANALRSPQCTCKDGNLEDDPLHFHSCLLLKKREVNMRHNLILYSLGRIAGDAGVPVIMEPRKQDDVPDRNRRPDAQLFGLSRSKPFKLTDVSITNPAAKSFCSGAATKALHAAKEREKAKENKYKSFGDFTPFVLELNGAYGPKAASLLKSLANGDLVEENQRSEFLLHARVLLSIALQKGNALIDRAGLRIVNGEDDIVSARYFA